MKPNLSQNRQPSRKLTGVGLRGPEAKLAIIGSSHSFVLRLNMPVLSTRRRAASSRSMGSGTTWTGLTTHGGQPELFSGETMHWDLR